MDKVDMSVSNLSRKKAYTTLNQKRHQNCTAVGDFFSWKFFCLVVFGFFFFNLLVSFVSVLQLLPVVICSFMELGSTLLFMRI